MKQIKEDTNITVKISSKLKQKYYEYCRKNKFVFARRIRALMEKDLKNEIKG